MMVAMMIRMATRSSVMPPLPTAVNKSVQDSSVAGKSQQRRSKVSDSQQDEPVPNDVEQA